MSNSIKVMYIPKAEYTEMTLTYPFALEKGDVMVLFVSKLYNSLPVSFYIILIFIS
jgi:hypothetical protein